MENETLLWKFRNQSEASLEGERHLIYFIQEVFNLYQALRTMIYISYSGNLLDRIRLTNLEIYSGDPKNGQTHQELIMIIIERLEDLEKYLNSIYHKHGFHSSDKYFVIYLGRYQIDLVFDLLWQFFITNAIVIDTVNDVYTYRPILDGCSAIRPKLLFNVKEANASAIFGYTLKHYNGCEIRAMAVKYPPYVIDAEAENNPGLEIDLLRASAKVLNFTLNFVRHNNTGIGERLGDNHFTHALRDVFANKSDILCGMFIGEPLMKEMDMSVFTYAGFLTVFAPRAMKIPAWKIISIIFEINVWMCLLALLILLNIYVYFVRIILPEDVTFILPFGVLLNQVIKQPKHFSLKFLYLTWTTVSYLLTSTYVTILIMFLTMPVYEKDVQNVDELKSNRLVLGLNRHLKRFVDLSDLNFELVECPVGMLCLKRTMTRKDMFVIDADAVAGYYSKHLTNKYGHFTLHKTDWQVLYFYLKFVIRKGHPIKEMLNALKSRFSENGLIIVWLSRALSPIRKRTKYQQFNAISLNFLSLAFGVYFTGLCAASLVFIYELKFTRKLAVLES